MSSRTNVPIHGNYHGYYSKRPFIRDPRLSLLSPSIFLGATVLDVGCNEGSGAKTKAREVAQSWGAHKVIGVDIDETLIRSAWKRRRTAWSIQAPAASTDEPEDATPEPKKRKRMDPASIFCRPDFFPASSEHMLGPLPIPSARKRGKHVFPHNVSFHTADWVANGIPEDSGSYNIVIAFSISKWIHLNAGDEGLMNFFRRVHSVMKPGGIFILEPQAWDTYGKAKRMDLTLKENAKGLHLRPEGFEKILRDIGFSPAQHVGSTGEGGFHRPVDLYIKS